MKIRPSGSGGGRGGAGKSGYKPGGVKPGSGSPISAIVTVEPGTNCHQFEWLTGLYCNVLLHIFLSRALLFF